MKRIIKLPWVRIEESTNKNAQKTKVVERDVSNIKNATSENQISIKEVSKVLKSVKGKVEVMEECASESEIEIISLSRRVKTIESKIAEIEFFKNAMIMESNREGIWNKALSCSKSLIRLAKSFIRKHHLMMASTVLMAAAVAGITYLFVYLM